MVGIEGVEHRVHCDGGRCYGKKEDQVLSVEKSMPRTVR